MPEIIIALAIIGVLSGITSINFLRQLPAYRLNGATRQIMWELMATRMQAVSQKRDITVTFPSSHQYKIWIDKNSDGIVDLGEEITKDLHPDYSGVNLTSTDNLTFKPTGIVMNLATITLTNASGSKLITVNTIGNVKMN